MSTAVTTQQPQQVTIRDRLKSKGLVAEIAKVIPEHCSAERMCRVALSTLTRTPKLASCTQESFFECLLALSQWGLEPDGRRAHLIPYGNKCTLIIDYKGYVELVYRSGLVKNIHADIVREGDIFRYSRGKLLDHVPWYLRRDAARPEKAGDVYAAYCVVELKGETEKCEVLSREDVEAIRSRSSSGKTGPWTTDWNEMAKKSAFRRVSKWLPMSADVQNAMDADGDKLESLQPVDAKSHPSMDDVATMLMNQPEPTEPQGEIIEEGQQEQSGATTGGHSLKPDFWADYQASLETCTTLGEVDEAYKLHEKHAQEQADITKLKNLAEMRKVVIRGKRGGNSSKGELFETTPNAQEN
jgi:recombination protein RecT